MSKPKKLLGLFPLVMVFGAVLAARATAGCSDAELTEATPCRGAGCTCEQDPSQERCRGYSPVDGSGVPGDAAVPDAPPGDADAGDATDAADSGDAGDADPGDATDEI